MKKRLALVFVCVLGLARMVLAQQPAIEGTLEIIVEDYLQTAVVRHSLILPDGRRMALRFVGPAPGQLRSGQRVRVTGAARLAGPDERAIDGRVGTIEMAQLEPVSALGSSSSFGEVKTLAILVTFTDAPSPSTSPSGATAVFQSVDAWDRATSQGQSWLATTVVGPFPIAQSRTPCDYSTTMALARQAATAAGVNITPFARVGVLMPSNACTWWGLGSVGGSQAQFWVNGSVTLKVVAHEMGHNYGLYHSNSFDIVSNQHQEYGDCCDMMGQAGSDPFQPFQDRRLGWLDYQASPITQTIAASGTYGIEPYAVVPWGGQLPKALRIPIDASMNYYVATLRGSVYVYRGSESSGNSAYQLKGGPLRPALPIGTTWTDTAHNIAILPLSATSITVSLAGAPPPPPTCPDPVATNYGGPLPCVYAPTTPPTQPPPSGTQSDTFQQPNGPMNPALWTLVNGGLTVTSNEVQDGTLNAYHIALANTLSGANQTGSMDFAFTNHQGIPRFGIVLRYQSPGNYYLLYRQAGGSALLRISKVVNGVETVLKAVTQANPAKDVFFRLQGTVSGTTLTLALGGTTKLTVTDQTFTTGGVGFLMGSTSGHLHRGDNFAGTIQ